jgi:WD40-like Beta Propeller Repeat
VAGRSAFDSNARSNRVATAEQRSKESDLGSIGSKETRIKTSAVRVALLLLIVEPAFAQAPGNAQLVDMVTRMARIGRASSPTFSPDGKRIAFVSDLNGVPQVWMAPVNGGALTQITKSDDPVWTRDPVAEGRLALTVSLNKVSVTR